MAAHSGFEYKQQKIRAADGRFDNVLNNMAAEGWRAISIDRVDELFLVTFSRQVDAAGSAHKGRVQTETEFETTQSVNYAEFDRLAGEMFSARWVLKHFAASAVQMGAITAVYYTCVWERATKRVVR